MLEAAEAGAVVRNHCEVLAVDVAQGRARGVLLRDRITGKDERVEAGWILNCTGPWADRAVYDSERGIGCCLAAQPPVELIEVVDDANHGGSYPRGGASDILTVRPIARPS